MGEAPVRLAVALGRLDHEALDAGPPNWPELYRSYDEMAAANGDHGSDVNNRSSDEMHMLKLRALEEDEELAAFTHQTRPHAPGHTQQRPADRPRR